MPYSDFTLKKAKEQLGILPALAGRNREADALLQELALKSQAVDF